MKTKTGQRGKWKQLSELRKKFNALFCQETVVSEEVIHGGGLMPLGGKEQTGNLQNTIIVNDFIIVSDF